MKAAIFSYHGMNEYKYAALNMPFTAYLLPNKDDIDIYKK